MYTEFLPLGGLPKGYSDFDNPRPLLIYLHGAGEVGKDVRILEQLDVVGFSKDKIEKEDFPFIVVSPMTPIRDWRPELVVRLLDEILADHGKRWKLDEKRVYLTGFSMGGFGTFSTGGEYPERFAAIAPIAGGGDPAEVEHFKNLPTWAFHGDVDEVVPYDCSSKMIEAMQANRCVEAKLTTMEGAGHGIVRDVYSNPKLYRWLLKHERK